MGKNWGQVFILDIIIFSIFAIFLPSFLSLRILSLTRLLDWETPDSPIPKHALFCSGSTRVDWNDFFVLRLWVNEKPTSGKSRQDFGV